jgi:hypothetical protein
MRAARSEYDAPSVRTADASDIGPPHLAREIERDDLYRAFKEYCEEAEYKKLSRAEFGQHLHAVVPGLQKARPGPRGKRRNVYVGIALRSSDDEPDLL